MSSFDVTIRNEVDYAINLKNTLNDFINKNVKLKRYFNLKEKKLIEFINSLCYFTKFYYKYKGPGRKEIWPSEIEKKTFPITCSNTIIILFPFEQISIIFPLTFLKDFTYLNQFSNILFEKPENSLQKNIVRLKYYNEINKKMMDGCKIIIATVEMKSILYIHETETLDISGGNIEPLKITDFFNKYL